MFEKIDVPQYVWVVGGILIFLIVLYFVSLNGSKRNIQSIPKEKMAQTQTLLDNLISQKWTFSPPEDSDISIPEHNILSVRRIENNKVHLFVYSPESKAEFDLNVRESNNTIELANASVNNEVQFVIIGEGNTPTHIVLSNYDNMKCELNVMIKEKND